MIPKKAMRFATTGPDAAVAIMLALGAGLGAIPAAEAQSQAPTSAPLHPAAAVAAPAALGNRMQEDVEAYLAAHREARGGDEAFRHWREKYGTWLRSSYGDDGPADDDKLTATLNAVLKAQYLPGLSDEGWREVRGGGNIVSRLSPAR
jgi:hypothetical protein